MCAALSVLKVESTDKEKNCRMLLHAVQNLPQHQYTKLEFEKFITLSDSGESKHAFRVEVVELLLFDFPIVFHQKLYNIQYTVPFLNKLIIYHVLEMTCFELTGKWNFRTVYRQMVGQFRRCYLEL